MDKQNFVPTSWVLKELALDEMPLTFALDSLSALITSKQVDLFFKEPVQGTDQSDEVDMQYGADGIFIGPFIGNGYSYRHEGEKKATALYFTSRFGGNRFAVQEYLYDGKPFYVTDSDGEWHREIHLEPEAVYFAKHQVEALSKRRAKSIDGPLKALALLAREMADKKGGKFKSGTKVNAKGFRDHLLSLAKHHDIPESYLKSLDDKLNHVLKELDLKDLPPEK